MHRAALTLLSAVILFAGCAEPTPGPVDAGANASPTQPAEPTPGSASLTSTQPAAANPTPAANPVTPPTPQPAANPYANPLRENTAPNPNPGFAGTAPQQPAAPPPSDVERVPAEVGVGRKGRSLDKYQDATQRVIVEPAKSLFVARERLTFNVQIPQAMNLYKAEHGHLPRSHEEFMKNIIEFNRIPLPDLRPGQRYVYDPQRGELMVERPVQ